MWREKIQPFKDRAMFWHAIWVSAGKPLNTQLHMLMKRTRNIYHLQIRRGKKMSDFLKKNTLLTACLDKGKDLFTEIKRLRKSEPSVASTIDGESKDIPNHFGHIYENLYNSVSDSQKLEEMSVLMNMKIDVTCLPEIERITPEVVSKAVSQLKSGKSDPVFKFCSDCIKNAPPVFYERLALMFRIFLTHGYISSILLVSNLIPLIKDKLVDVCSSDNYRSIAISSIILKVFDWIIILLYGEMLELDQLQFSYQPNVSTNMCTWAATETIDYFLRNGSDVFVCTMDMSKAFDSVKHSLLFEKLLQRGIPVVYTRLLLHMYRTQLTRVVWNNVESREFSISNGVKQGAVLSAILYCLYVNGLYRILRKKIWVLGKRSLLRNVRLLR